MAQVLHPSPSDTSSTTYSSSSNRFSRPRQPKMTTPQLSLTGKIVRKSVRVLLESYDFQQAHILALIDVSVAADCSQEEERELHLVEKIADYVKRLVKDKAVKVPTCDDYEQLQWVIHVGNIHSEYRRVTEEMFSSGVHWGKIVALLTFATNYTLYAISKGIDGSIVESVCGWTIVFMERELGSWFEKHSWEEFVSYAERVLSARHRHEMDTPGWQRAATIGGVIGLGAMLAFTIGNALS